MKYSINPFRWLLYLARRIRYRHSWKRWLNYYVPIPYTKRYVHEKLRKAFSKTKFVPPIKEAIDEQCCELLKMTLKDMPRLPSTYWQDVMDAKLAGRPLL